MIHYIQYIYNIYNLFQLRTVLVVLQELIMSCRTILLNVPPVIAMSVMSCIIGLIVLAYYSSIKCDPLANKDISNPNMVR